MFRILWLLSAHGTVLAWGSEHVQNIMTTVCTWYSVSLGIRTCSEYYDYCLHMVQLLAWGSEHVQNIMTTVCTWYKVIKSTVRTHYKLFITTVCTWCKVINSTFGTQSHSPSVSSFTLQLVFFLPIMIHFITIFFFHIQILWMVSRL